MSTAQAKMMKPSRNQPCPCGSGKKFKHCCDGKHPSGIPGSAAALQSGIRAHQAGRLAEAETIYKAILVRDPEHADAMHLLGLAYHGAGQSDRAYDWILQALVRQPEAAIYHSNLADVCRSLGRLDESLEAAQRACALLPDLPEANYQLGKTLRMQKKHEEAVHALQTALSLKPALVDASLMLAKSLWALKRKEEAVARLEAAYTLQPGHLGVITALGETLRMLDRHDAAIRHYQGALESCPAFAGPLYSALAEAYKSAGDLDSTARCYRKLLEFRPDDELVRHHLNAVTGEHSAAPPPDYVRKLFDGYADTFDAHLVKTLAYQTHILLGEAIREVAGSSRKDLDCLDLGCGTGLLGPEIRMQCRSLVGCDLSEKMVARARERKLYDQLDVSDLQTFLAARDSDSADLLAAADVFVYLGQLDAIFEQGHRVLRPGGWLTFSVEWIEDGGRDYVLRSSGRYAHASSYINRLCELGYTVVQCRDVTLRHEANQPMTGQLYVLEAG
jgi:predicted TPR repeat methyltransferase